MNKRKQILNALGNIRPLPASTGRLLSLVNDPDAPIDEISRTVEHDPELAANLLRLVNSSYYSPRSPIGSIRDAIARIGVREVTRFGYDQSYFTVDESRSRRL